MIVSIQKSQAVQQSMVDLLHKEMTLSGSKHYIKDQARLGLKKNPRIGRQWLSVYSNTLRSGRKCQTHWTITPLVTWFGMSAATGPGLASES